MCLAVIARAYGLKVFRGDGSPISFDMLTYIDNVIADQRRIKCDNSKLLNRLMNRKCDDAYINDVKEAKEIISYINSKIILTDSSQFSMRQQQLLRDMVKKKKYFEEKVRDK